MNLNFAIIKHDLQDAADRFRVWLARTTHNNLLPDCFDWLDLPGHADHVSCGPRFMHGRFSKRSSGPPLAHQAHQVSTIPITQRLNHAIGACHTLQWQKLHVCMRPEAE